MANQSVRPRNSSSVKSGNDANRPNPSAKRKRRIRRSSVENHAVQDEFIRQNADVIWLHQNEMWELIVTTP
jgi:hypothetical protein